MTHRRLGVAMRWADKILKLVKHRVPFTCQDTHESAFITERHNTVAF